MTIIKIGSVEVPMKASAGTPLRYRLEFGEDILIKLQQMSKENPDTEGIMKLAYVMAKQANPELKEEFMEWLDQFDYVSFLEASKEILSLWIKNSKTASKSKKK